MNTLEKFATWLDDREFSERTIRVYRQALRGLQKYVKKPLTEIKKENIESYFTYTKRRGLGARSRYRELNTYKTFIKFLLSDDKRFSPFSKRWQELTLIKMFLDDLKIKTPKKFPEIPTPDEIKRLRDYIDKNASLRDKVIFELFISSGVRIGELRNLYPKDIDLEKKTLLIRRGKGKKDRYTFFNGRATKILKEYLPTVPKSQRLIPLSNAGVWKIVRNCTTKAGRKLHPHSFRHYFVTALIRGGMPIAKVAMLAGHDNINTTMGYLHLTVEDRKREYDRCNI